jgi:diguanylate cyclase (GGDEF)-like protein
VPLDQLLLTLLAVAILANVLLVAVVPLRARRQRRLRQPDQLHTSRSIASAPGLSEPRPGSAAGDPPTDGDDDARAAAAIEAFVAEVAVDAAGRIRPPAPSEVISRTRDLERPIAPPPEPTIPPQAERPFHAPALTSAGLTDAATWDRAIREESARVARFGRPVTVVIAELPQVEEIASRLGRDVADRVVAETTRVLVAEGRAVDRIAWLGEAQFGVLLLETAEADAGTYVDRVRAAADGWFESAGLSTRLSLGWASPTDGGDLIGAVATARQRMHGGKGEPDGSRFVVVEQPAE